MKKLIFATMLFIVGYYLGAERIPRGTELLILMIVSFISGAYVMRIIQRIAQSKRIKLFKYEIRKVRVDAPLTIVETVVDAEVTPPKRTRQTRSSNVSECDLCNGEDVRIAGGAKIPCPKCSPQRKFAEN